MESRGRRASHFRASMARTLRSRSTTRDQIRSQPQPWGKPLQAQEIDHKVSMDVSERIERIKQLQARVILNATDLTPIEDKSRG